MKQLTLLFNRKQRQKVLASMMSNILRTTTFLNPLIFQVQTCVTFKNYLLQFYQRQDKIFTDVFGKIGYFNMISTNRERNVFAFFHYVYHYFADIWNNPGKRHHPDVWCKDHHLTVESFWNIMYPLNYSERKILAAWKSKISYW